MSPHGLHIAMLLASLAPIGPACAQLAPGKMFVGGRGLSTLPGPDPVVVDVLGAAPVTPAGVTNLSAPGKLVGAVEMDPVTGALWIADVSATPSLRRMHIDPQTHAISNETSVAPISNARDMAFGPNGELYVLSQLGLHVLERGSSSLRMVWNAAGSNVPEPGALSVDRVAEKLWIGRGQVLPPLPGEVLEFDLLQGFGSPTSIYTTPSGSDTSFNGLAHDGQGGLAVATAYSIFSPTRLSSYLLDTTVRPATASINPNFPTFPVSAIEVNRLNGEWILGIQTIAATGNFVMRWDFASGDAPQVLATGISSFPSFLDSMALNDLTGRTTLFPRSPAADVAFTLEIAAHGNPLDEALLLVTFVDGLPCIPPLVIAQQTCDAAGFSPWSYAFPPLWEGRSITFQTVTGDLATGSFTLGTSETMTAR